MQDDVLFTFPLVPAPFSTQRVRVEKPDRQKNNLVKEGGKSTLVRGNAWWWRTTNLMQCLMARPLMDSKKAPSLSQVQHVCLFTRGMTPPSEFDKKGRKTRWNYTGIPYVSGRGEGGKSD